jgi:hypothetical protein
VSSSKRSNVVAFPLERSKERALSRRVLDLRDGKIVSALAQHATTASLLEWLERVQERTSRLNGTLFEPR